MTTTEKFQTWADEINKDWTGYTAEATEEATVVFLDDKEEGRIDYDRGRYTITSDDENVRSQLEYMVNR